MLTQLTDRTLKAGLFAAGAALAISLAAPEAFAEQKEVKLETGQVFELTFLKDLAQPATGRDRTTSYFDASLRDQIKQAGGEFVFALDTVSVEEGLIEPDAVGFTIWPSIDAHRNFAGEKAVADHRPNVQHMSTFVQVPQTIEFTLDDDLYYEFFGVNFNALNQPMIMEFFGAVIPSAVEHHGRTPVADFTVLDVPESTFPSQAVGLVSWPSNMDFKNFSDSEVLQSNVLKRNSAVDNFYAVFGDLSY